MPENHQPRTVDVDFYTAEWCPPCKTLKGPKGAWTLATQKYAGIVRFTPIDADTQTELFREAGVQHPPQIRLYLVDRKGRIQRGTMTSFPTNQDQAYRKLAEEIERVLAEARA